MSFESTTCSPNRMPWQALPNPKRALLAAAATTSGAGSITSSRPSDDPSPAPISARDVTSSPPTDEVRV